jgi:hypothetical protein
MLNPRKWHDVYPQGTKEGDEELVFFKALARHPKYSWRNTSTLAHETGLPRRRVEELITKYVQKGMIFQNPSKDEEWAYWERVPQLLLKDNRSITEKDHDIRIGDQLKDTGLESSYRGNTAAFDNTDDGWVQSYFSFMTDES